MSNSIILKIIEAILLNGDRGEVGAVFREKKKKKCNGIQTKPASRPSRAAGHENNWTPEASELQLPPSTVLSVADMAAVERLTSRAPSTHRSGVRVTKPGAQTASVIGSNAPRKTP